MSVSTATVPLGRPGSVLSELVPRELGIDATVETVDAESLIPQHVLDTRDEGGVGDLDDVLTSMFTELYTPPASPKATPEPEPVVEEEVEEEPEETGKKGKKGKGKSSDKPKKPEKKKDDKKGSKKGPGEIKGVTVDVSNPVATQLSSYVFNFALTQEVPGNGAIVLTFPEGYDLLATGPAHEVEDTEAGDDDVVVPDDAAVDAKDGAGDESAAVQAGEGDAASPRHDAATMPMLSSQAAVVAVTPTEDEGEDADEEPATKEGEDEEGNLVPIGTLFDIRVEGNELYLTRPKPAVTEEEEAAEADPPSRPSSKGDKKKKEDKKKGGKAGAKGGKKGKEDAGPPLLPANARFAGGIRIAAVPNPSEPGVSTGFTVRTIGGDNKVIDQQDIATVTVPDIDFAAPPPPPDEYTPLLEAIAEERDNRVAAVNDLEAYIRDAREAAIKQQEQDDVDADDQFTELRRQTGVPVGRTRFDLDKQRATQFGLLNLKQLLDEHQQEFADARVLKPNQVQTVDVLTKLTSSTSKITALPDPSADTPGLNDTSASLSSSKGDPMSLETPITFAKRGPEIEAEKRKARQAKVEAKKAKIRSEMMLPKEREGERKYMEKMSVKANFLKNPRHTAERGVQKFRAEPELVSFTDYKVGEVYEAVLTLRNISRVSHRVRCLPPASPHFSISALRFPRGESLIAPGCICQVTVFFAPDSLADFDDELVLEDDAGVVTTVSLTALRPPPVLSCGPEWECGYGLVGSMTVLHFPVTNTGGDGRFRLFPAHEDDQVQSTDDGNFLVTGPFTIRPATCSIPAGHTEEFVVEFAPNADQAGDIARNFRIACDNLQTLECTLVAEATVSQVGISAINGNEVDIMDPPKSLVFGETSVNARVSKTITLSNPTGVALPFSWTLFRGPKDGPPQTIPARDLDIDLAALTPEPADTAASDNAHHEQSQASRNDGDGYYEDDASAYGKASSYAGGERGDSPSGESEASSQSTQHESETAAPRSPHPLGSQQLHVGARAPRPFVISPRDGVIDAHSTVDIVITFEPASVTPYLQVAHLSVGDLDDSSEDSSRRCEQRLTLRGAGRADRLSVDTPLVSFPGHLLAGQLYRRVFHLHNPGAADVAFSWRNMVGPNAGGEEEAGSDPVTSRTESSSVDTPLAQIIEVQPATGVIHRDSHLQLELVVRATKPGPLESQLICESANGPPVHMKVRADVTGPEVRIVDPEVAFGLVLLGSSVEQPLTIENLSEGIANWSLRLHDSPTLTPELLEEIQIYPPSGTLRGFHSQDITVSFRPGRTAEIVEALELVVEGSATPEYVRLTAHSRTAHVCLNRLDVDFGTAFVDVPSTQTVTLKNLTLFETGFAWDDATFSHPQYELRAEPASGVVKPRGYTEVKFTLIPRYPGAIEAVIPCDIDGMDLPVGFQMNAEVRGFEVQYALEPKYPDEKPVLAPEVKLDFGDDVDIFDTRTVKFTVHNSSANESPFEFSFMRFGAPNSTDLENDPLFDDAALQSQLMDTQRSAAAATTAAAPVSSRSQRPPIGDGIPPSTARSGMSTVRRGAGGGVVPSSRLGSTFNGQRAPSRGSIASRLSNRGGSGAASSLGGDSGTHRLLSRQGTPMQRPVGVSMRTLTTQTARQDQESINKRTRVAEALAHGDGIAFTVEPSEGILAPYGTIDVTVTLYCDMYGTYEDFLCCQYPGIETRYLAVSAGVVGSPLYIAPNSLGLTLRTEPPSVNCGVLSANSDPVTRSITIGNRAPCDLEVSWLTVNHTGKFIDLDLQVVDEESGQLSLALTEIPPTQSDHPFLVSPKTLRVPAKGTAAMTVTYHPSPEAGPYLAALAGSHINFASEEKKEDGDDGGHDPRKTHELTKSGTELEIDVLGRIVEPRLTMDKKARLHFKVHSSASADDPTFTRTFNLTNATEAPLAFYIRSESDVFEVVSVTSSAARRPRAAVALAQTTDHVAMFPPGVEVIQVQPRDNANVVVRMLPPANIHDLLEDAENGYVHVDGSLVARYALGHEQTFPLEATIYAPTVTTNPDMIEFGERLVKAEYTATFVVSNPTLADARWSITHVSPRSRVIDADASSSNNTTPDVHDDPGVFTFEPSHGVIRGHGGLQPRTVTVVAKFSPKKAFDYVSNFELHCENGIHPCQITMRGNGSYEETLAPPPGAVIHGSVAHS